MYRVKNELFVRMNISSKLKSLTFKINQAMKRFNLLSGIFACAIIFCLAGCEFVELSADKDQPRCDVLYSVVFSNTSKTDVYMGMNANPSASEIVKAGNSRTDNNGVNLLMTSGHEEEHLVEIHVRGLDSQFYNYKSYFIRPKDWKLTVDPENFNLAHLKLRINCVFNGTETVVTVTQQ